MARESKGQKWTNRVMDALRASGGGIDGAARRLHISPERLEQSIINIERNHGIDRRSSAEITQDLNASDIADETGSRSGVNWDITYYDYHHGQQLPNEQDFKRYQAIITGFDKYGNERKYTTTLYDSLSGALSGAAGLASLYTGDTFVSVEIAEYEYIGEE